MKILTLHNKYKYRGGEDEARESEDVLLRERGHEVKEIVLDNNDIGPSGLVRIGMETSWSVGSYRRVCEAVKEWRPDILDVHNFFPLFSPSVHYVGLKQRVPVIQTLHNYRLLCPGATFYRAGPCVRTAPGTGSRGQALFTAAIAGACHKPVRPR